jgi:uncharacterized protein YqgV (UPF0045/DUF77 family)
MTQTPKEKAEEAKFVTVNIESATGEDLGKVSYIPLPNVDYIPKQETIEEAANRILSKEGVKLHPSGLETYLKGNVINAMVEMAKWQQERMFELVEEYNQMLIDPNVHEDHKEKSFKEWFKQFKNK